ncbi:MAG: CbiQ family ECF transporter T component [Gemmatimonadota bacterium]
MLRGDLFGSGGGVMARAAPPTRLLFATMIVAACVAVPDPVGRAVAFTALVAGATALACAAPRRVILRAAAFGALLYLPLATILIVPALLDARADPLDAASYAAGIAVRGTAVLLVTLAVLSTVRASELHVAIGGLPLPRTARLLLIQIAHQTGVLFDETRRVNQAIALRRGRRSGLRLVAGLPRVWLERIASRAERTAAAMDVRGYVDWDPRSHPWSGADHALVAAGAATLLAALLMHAVP